MAAMALSGTGASQRGGCGSRQGVGGSGGIAVLYFWVVYGCRNEGDGFRQKSVAGVIRFVLMKEIGESFIGEAPRDKVENVMSRSGWY